MEYDTFNYLGMNMIESVIHWKKWNNFKTSTSASTSKLELLLAAHVSESYATVRNDYPLWFP